MLAAVTAIRRFLLMALDPFPALVPPKGLRTPFTSRPFRTRVPPKWRNSTIQTRPTMSSRLGSIWQAVPEPAVTALALTPCRLPRSDDLPGGETDVDPLARARGQTGSSFGLGERCARETRKGGPPPRDATRRTQDVATGSRIASCADGRHSRTVLGCNHDSSRRQRMPRDGAIQGSKENPLATSPPPGDASPEFESARDPLPKRPRGERGDPFATDAGPERLAETFGDRRSASVTARGGSRRT